MIDSTVKSWTEEEIDSLVEGAAGRIMELRGQSARIWGVPRGGTEVVDRLVKAYPGLRKVDYGYEAEVIVDDLIDSGTTRAGIKAKLPDIPFVALIDKAESGDTRWHQFPWEEDQLSEAEQAVRRLLQSLNQDTRREGLIDTPKRHVKYLKEFLNPPEFKFTTFENEGTDEMVIQKDIPFHSLCEHHLLPFFGTATIAYIPATRIVGLSKLARTVEHYTRRLQNQERITKQIAERLMEELGPHGVAVSLTARHMCMEMRGVKKACETVTTHLTGYFRDNASTRQEFLAAK